MEKSEIVYWQIVWFFSMEEPAQRVLIGSTHRRWFIEEDERNRGANYLLGLCYAFTEITRPFDNHADHLHAAIVAISQNLEPSYWAYETLSRTAEWSSIRAVALKLLERQALLVAPPRKPFQIESLLHVDHFQHASKIRGRTLKDWR